MMCGSFCFCGKKALKASECLERLPPGGPDAKTFLQQQWHRRVIILFLVMPVADDDVFGESKSMAGGVPLVAASHSGLAASLWHPATCRPQINISIFRSPTMCLAKIIHGFCEEFCRGPCRDSAGNNPSQR